jgi:hypothetical protein
MAFFGLFGNDRQMANGQYAGRETATQRNERKKREASARRAQRSRAQATRVDRAAWRDQDAQIRAERQGRRPRW